MIWKAWADASFHRGTCGLAVLLVSPEGTEASAWARQEAGSSVEAEGRAIRLAIEELIARKVTRAVVRSDCQPALADALPPMGYRLAYARDAHTTRVDRMAERVRCGLSPTTLGHRPLPPGLVVWLSDGRPRSLSALIAALPLRHRSRRERVRIALDLLLDNVDRLAWQEGGIVLQEAARGAAETDEQFTQRLLAAAGDLRREPWAGGKAQLALG